MHEMNITRSILEIIKKEMDKNSLTRLNSLKIKVGELTAVEPDTLRFCFEACTKDTDMEGAVLEIEKVPLTGKCGDCGAMFRLRSFISVCPVCKGRSIEKMTGTELDIVSMDAT